MAVLEACHSLFPTIPSALVLLPVFLNPIPEVGRGQCPQKSNKYNVFFGMQKIQKVV